MPFTPMNKDGFEDFFGGAFGPWICALVLVLAFGLEENNESVLNEF